MNALEDKTDKAISAAQISVRGGVKETSAVGYAERGRGAHQKI